MGDDIKRAQRSEFHVEGPDYTSGVWIAETPSGFQWGLDEHTPTQNTGWGEIPEYLFDALKRFHEEQKP